MKSAGPQVTSGLLPINPPMMVSQGKGPSGSTRIVFLVMRDDFGDDGSIYEVVCRFCTAIILVYDLVHEPIFFALTAPLAGADAFPI